MLIAARLLRAFCSRSRMTPAWQARAACSLLLLRRPPFRTSQRSPSPMSGPAACARHWKPVLSPQRTRLAYNRVIDAYRAIYHNDPASPKADTSVLAVAQLLAEEGRLFADQKLLQRRHPQYEFLRSAISQRPITAYRQPDRRRRRGRRRDDSSMQLHPLQQAGRSPHPAQCRSVGVTPQQRTRLPSPPSIRPPGHPGQRIRRRPPVPRLP